MDKLLPLLSLYRLFQVAKLFSFTWTFGALACKLLYYMQTVSAICSVLNLTALSFERYYAIVHPLKAQYHCTLSRAQKTVVIAWLGAFILGTPVLFVQIHMEVGMRRKAYWCVRDFDNEVKWRALESYLFAVILVAPAVAMSFSYASIIREVCRVVKQRRTLTQNFDKLKKSRHRQTQNEEPMLFEEATVVLENDLENIPLSSAILPEDEQKPPRPQEQQGGNKKSAKLDEETKQVVRMLIFIVAVYIACWAPLLTFNLLQSFGVVNTYLMGGEKHAKTAFSLMAYVNRLIDSIRCVAMQRIT